MWWGADLPAALLCSSKFVFQLDHFLDLDFCVSTSSSAGIIKEQHLSVRSSVILRVLLSRVENTIGKSLAFIC